MGANRGDPAGVSIAPRPGLVPRGARRMALSRGAVFVGEGAGPALLCIPGGYHGAWCFDVWLALFRAAGIRAAALEPRGKGTAAPGDPATSVEDYAADAVEAVAALGGEVVLLGHSLGALVAMRAAERLGGVAGLVLAAPSPPGNLPGAAKVKLVAEDAMVPPPSREVAMARFCGGEDVAGLAEYVAALSPESPRALNDRYALRVAIDPARLAGAQVLVIEAGRDDAARHPAGQDAAIARFLGGEHVLLRDAPHCLMLAPWAEESAGVVVAWWRRALTG